MVKKFKIARNSRYYLSEDIARKAIGYDSLGSYILALETYKENNQNPALVVAESAERLAKSQEDIADILKQMKAELSPKTFEDHCENLKILLSKITDMAGPEHLMQLPDVQKDLKKAFASIKKLTGD